MLLDLLSTDNLVNYNVKIAQIMGLHTAIYINELINISNKAIKKKKLEYAEQLTNWVRENEHVSIIDL